jgi:hypothetical protein
LLIKTPVIVRSISLGFFGATVLAYVDKLLQYSSRSVTVVFAYGKCWVPPLTNAGHVLGPRNGISYQTNSIAFLSSPAPASPSNLFANQKFFFCPSVFYQGIEPLLWSQGLDRGADPVEDYFIFFSQKICWALLVFVFH